MALASSNSSRADKRLFNQARERLRHMAASSFFRLIGDIAWARLMAEQPSLTCKEKESANS
jgi:hypothetical protein